MPHIAIDAQEYDEEDAEEADKKQLIFQSIEDMGVIYDEATKPRWISTWKRKVWLFTVSSQSILITHYDDRKTSQILVLVPTSTTRNFSTTRGLHRRMSWSLQQRNLSFSA